MGLDSVSLFCVHFRIVNISQHRSNQCAIFLVSEVKDRGGLGLCSYRPRSA